MQTTIAQARDIEKIKQTIYSLFKDKSHSSCISACDSLIHRKVEKDDMSYDIYAYTFKWLSYDRLDDHISASQCFLKIDSYNVNDEFTLDDLWVYFFFGLAKSKLCSFQETQTFIQKIFPWYKSGKINKLGKLNRSSVYSFRGKENHLFTVIDTVKRWFEVFPNNERDFRDDIEGNLRLNIINKYLFIVWETFDIFWYWISMSKNADDVVINFGLVDKESGERILLFWYKRPDWYGTKYLDQTERENFEKNSHPIGS